MILRYKRQCILLCAIFFVFEWPFCPGENNFSDNIKICFAKISFDYPLFLWRMLKFCAFLLNMEGDESVLRGCCASPFKNPCSTRDGWQEAKFVHCKISVSVMCLHFMGRFLVKISLLCAYWVRERNFWIWYSVSVVKFDCFDVAVYPLYKFFDFGYTQQTWGLVVLWSIIPFLIFAMKTLTKATAIIVPIAVPWICK